jgi:BirA family biotin operon repressor/biotin-[acetyl-CoA-carboxylase] ligase
MAVATGVLEFLNRYISCDLSVKWPNDIYWRDRKAAGILIENIVQGGEWKWAVIGVGVNVAQTHFPDMTRKPVSIKQITGRPDLVPVRLAKELCSHLYAACKWVVDHPDAVITAYNAALFRLNQPQKFRQANRIFKGIVRKVTPEGRLVLEHSFEESFAVGEIEWVIE